jgi:serine acetyltransferase
VVASGSVVNKDFSEQGEELLLAGVPATVKGRATYALKNVSTR